MWNTVKNALLLYLVFKASKSTSFVIFQSRSCLVAEALHAEAERRGCEEESIEDFACGPVFCGSRVAGSA